MHHVCINTLKCSDLAFSLPRGGVSTIVVPARLLLSSCCLPLFTHGKPRGKCVSMTHSLLIASRIPVGFFTIVMSLLPVAVVVVAFFFLFRMLGGKPEKATPPQPLQSPKSHQPPQTPPRRRSSESSLRPASVPIDGLASFHFVEGNPYAKPSRPSTPPRRHPCRVCGIPATKRCIHCKSAYYCSKEHSTQVSFHAWNRKSMYLRL